MNVGALLAPGRRSRLSDERGDSSPFPNVTDFVGSFANLWSSEQMLSAAELQIRRRAHDVALHIARKSTTKWHQFREIPSVRVVVRCRSQCVLQFHYIADAEVAKAQLASTQIVIGGNGGVSYSGVALIVRIRC